MTDADDLLAAVLAVRRRRARRAEEPEPEPPAAPTLTAPTATNPSPDAVLANGEVSIALSATAEAGLSALRWYAYPDGSAWDGPGAVQLGEDTDGGDTSYADTLAILDLDLATHGHDWHIVAVAHGPGGSTPSTPVAVTVERLTLVRDWVLSDSNYTFPTNYWSAEGSTPGTRYGRRVRALGNGGGGTQGVGAGGGAARTYLDEVGTSAQVVAVAGIAATAADTSATDVTWASTALIAKGGLSGTAGGTGGQAAACTPAANAFSGGNGGAGSGNQIAGASAGYDSAAVLAVPGEPNGSLATNLSGARVWGVGGISRDASQFPASQGLVEVIYYAVAPRGAPRVIADAGGRSIVDSTALTVARPAESHVSSDSRGRNVLFISSDGGSISASATGWAALTPVNATAVSGMALHIESTGSESTAVTLSASEQAAWRVLRIVAYDGGIPETPEWTTVASSGANADSPNHTPSGGSDDYLWVSAVGHDANAVLSTYDPLALFGGVRVTPAQNSAGPWLGSAYRYSTTDALNPAAWTTSIEEWWAATLSIRDAP